jgi:hypothetical protein
MDYAAVYTKGRKLNKITMKKKKSRREVECGEVSEVIEEDAVL